MHDTLTESTKENVNKICIFMLLHSYLIDIYHMGHLHLFLSKSQVETLMGKIPLPDGILWTACLVHYGLVDIFSTSEKGQMKSLN